MNQDAGFIRTNRVAKANAVEATKADSLQEEKMEGNSVRLKIAAGEQVEIYVTAPESTKCDGHQAGARATFILRGPTTICLVKSAVPAEKK